MDNVNKQPGLSKKSEVGAIKEIKEIEHENSSEEKYLQRMKKKIINLKRMNH